MDLGVPANKLLANFEIDPNTTITSHLLDNKSLRNLLTKFCINSIPGIRDPNEIFSVFMCPTSFRKCDCLAYAVDKNEESSSRPIGLSQDSDVQDSDCSRALLSLSSTSMANPTLIEKIPNDILIKIFGQLNLNSLLRCGLVNRKFKDAIDHIEIKRLSVIGEEELRPGILSDIHYFFFDFKPIDPNDIFFTKDLNFFKSDFIREILEDLEELNINAIFSGSDFDISFLNRFKKLKKLQLLEFKLKKNVKLDLPNLETLAVGRISEYSCESCELELDLPKLQNFKSDNLKNIRFLYFDKITHLAQKDYDENSPKFISLKFFYYTGGVDSNQLPDNLLTLFPLLEELHCRFIGKEYARNLLLDKERLNRKDFTLVYCGFKINSIEDLNEYMNEAEEYLIDLRRRTDLIALNYAKTDLFHFITEIDYDHRIQRLYSENKESFGKKFFQVYAIIVREPVLDEEQFIEFIKNFKYIKVFVMKNSLLSIYDQFPVLFPFLTTLTIKEELMESKLDFIFKLKELKSIGIKFQTFSSNFIRKAFKELKNLTTFQFWLNNRQFLIIYSSDIYINIFNENLRTVYRNTLRTFDELIECLDNQILKFK